MKITDQAKQLLERLLSEKGAEGIRISATAGCCGPQFSISMDAPQESDKIETINGIKVAIDPEVYGTEELTIDKEDNQNSLVLIGGSGCC